MTMPQPFETVVKEDMEDYHHKAARQEWFDLLHTAAPEDDWRKIEQQELNSGHKSRRETERSQSQMANILVSGKREGVITKPVISR